MINREQIEKDIRAEVEGTSASNEYVVYLTTEDQTSLVMFKGDLDTGIQNFLSQIDDEGKVLNDAYRYVNIGSAEEFAQISSPLN